MKGRRIFSIRSLAMRAYDMDSLVQPGAATIPHENACREEFLVLEGEAIVEDGTVLQPGDWIACEPGTRHGTRTVAGWLLIGLDWDPPT